MTITNLSPDQTTAIEQMMDWWDNLATRGYHKRIINDNEYTMEHLIDPVLLEDAGWGKASYKLGDDDGFVITGAAGTGKSTVVAEMLQRLDIMPDEALMVATAATAVKNIQAKNPNAMATTIASLIKEPIQYVGFTKNGHTKRYTYDADNDDFPKTIQTAIKKQVAKKAAVILKTIQDQKQAGRDEQDLHEPIKQYQHLNNCEQVSEALFMYLSDDDVKAALKGKGYTFFRQTKFETAEHPGRTYKTAWEDQHAKMRGAAFKYDDLNMLIDWETSHPYHKVPKIIIVDELGMVKQSDFEAILDINIPVLALGDPYQLPAIGNADDRNQRIYEPDAMLTKIHRQNADAKILDVANAAKDDHNWLKAARDATNAGANDVYYNPSHHWSTTDYLGANVILTATNRNVIQYNHVCHAASLQQQHLRQTNGLMVGEPIVITVNTDQKMTNGAPVLANGQTGIITKIYRIDHLDQVALIDLQVGTVTIHHFYLNITDLFDPRTNEDSLRQTNAGFNLLRRRWDAAYLTDPQNELQEVVYGAYGYAMTIHKSQGKEWDRVMLDAYVPSPMARDENKLIYTAITRAKQKLVII